MKTPSWIILTVACLICIICPSCTTPPDRDPRTLRIQTSVPATMTLTSSSLRYPLPIGDTPYTNDRLTLNNTLIADKELRKGKDQEQTTVLIEKLRNTEILIRSKKEPDLYKSASISVPPWNHDIDLGLPAKIEESELMGILFEIKDETGAQTAGYRLKLQDREHNLPFQMELKEGEYIFKLIDPSGTAFSGRLKLYNADNEFVNFAYVPVFQKITPVELAEIARREKEPRLYTSTVEESNTLLSQVWIGSRTSTENILIGNSQPKNIEIIFQQSNATITIQGETLGPRFFLSERQKEYELEFTVQRQNKSPLKVYGLLEIPKITRSDTTLTSFEIQLNNEEIYQIVGENKVIKKYGIYRAPEKPDETVPIYNLILGKRKPRAK